MSDKRYPLSWPAGWPRARWRRSAQFGTGTSGGGKRPATVAEAVVRLQGEVDRLGGEQVILSTNMELRLDGLPRSDRAAPADPAAAIYFKLKGRDIVLACDKWDRVADNIIAIAKHIEALRGMDRWGVGSIEQAFRGYEALPPPGGLHRSWREILGFRPDEQIAGPASIDARYRELAARAHPDRGGNHNDMAELNRARAEAKATLA